MPVTEDVDTLPAIGRRDQQRLRLQIPAKLISLEGAEPVLLLDLSRSGARIACQNAPAFKRGVLQWMNYEFYGEVMWRREKACALRFDPDLDQDIILTTRQLAPQEWQRHTQSMIEAARTWRASVI